MKIRLFGSLAGLLVCAAGSAAGYPPEVERALARAGSNRAELVQALDETPAAERKGMEFLIANMPERDLKSLSAAFLRDNVRLAYRARAEFPWGRNIPEDIFLNNVLPYANVDEERHPWRRDLYDLCRPLIQDCTTPAEVAQRLNTKVFPLLKVRYSTERKKPHQSPKESIASGKASCTGLSILLADACRSVAVPTRLVGTPLWANKSGNHTWIEIWDGRWHFTGACEPDPKGLDHAWFEHNASEAKKASALHAIYAVSFRRTDISFPLVWDPDRKDVFAENVTDHYAKAPANDPKQVRVLVRVHQGKRRIALPVEVVDPQASDHVLRGESRGEGADTNDLLAFELMPHHEYLLRVGNPVRVEQRFRTTSDKQQTVDVSVSAEKPRLTTEQRQQAAQAAGAFFAADESQRAGWKFDSQLDRWLVDHEAELRAVVWEAYRTAPIHAELKKDFEETRVRYQKYVSPYVVRKVGKRPPNGWPLFIAMHGGGGVAKEINDSQWRHMQIYYRDQKAVTGYQYLALRAPNDVWNGFYDDYVPPLIVNLIRQFLLFGDVDPNRIYLMGYSHGGYGAFFIGPKIPDRFAAVHCSASAPTDGTISPRTLRNVRFTFMIGENDNAYGRRERCERFNTAMQKLKDENAGDYPVEMQFKNGFGHGGLPDRDKVKDMYPFTRNPVPGHVTWDLTDPVIRTFYWLAVPEPGKDRSLDAMVRDNEVHVRTRNVRQFELDLDGRLVAFDRPLRVFVDGKEQVVPIAPQFRTLCESVQERGDPELAFTCRLRWPR
jgi:hypothetical protein